MTACLTIQCHGTSGTDLAALLDQYHRVDTTSTPGLPVFHTRLGLSFVDAIGTVDDPPARQIAASLIDYATAARDGYAARDLLAHNGCRELLTRNQTRELTELVDACALGRGTIPATMLADLTTALAAGRTGYGAQHGRDLCTVHALARPQWMIAVGPFHHNRIASFTREVAGRQIAYGGTHPPEASAARVVRRGRRLVRGR